MNTVTTPTVPQHVAIIMDGNRRWATNHNLPKTLGHASGARRVRPIVQACSDAGVRYVTLFAFSTENWQRPEEEVIGLMSLLVYYLEKEVKDMSAMGVRLKIVGDVSRFDSRLRRLIAHAQEKTAHNTTITMSVAINYGGRWDIVQAARAWQLANPQANAAALTEQALQSHLSMAWAPDPDLIIRTGGESRISNFLLWQAAYSEIYMTNTLWPDFSPEQLQRAIAWYATRDRRFGGTSPSPAQATPPAPHPAPYLAPNLAPYLPSAPATNPAQLLRH